MPHKSQESLLAYQALFLIKAANFPTLAKVFQSLGSFWTKSVQDYLKQHFQIGTPLLTTQTHLKLYGALQLATSCTLVKNNKYK